MTGGSEAKGLLFWKREVRGAGRAAEEERVFIINEVVANVLDCRWRCVAWWV